MAQDLILQVVGLDGSEILPRTLVDKNSRVGELQERVRISLGKPVILVSPEAEALPASKRVGQLALTDGSILTAVANKAIRLEIKGFQGAEYCITVDNRMKLSDLWWMLQENKKVACTGCFIDDRTARNFKEREGGDRSLDECGFIDGSRLHMTLPFRGVGPSTEHPSRTLIGRRSTSMGNRVRAPIRPLGVPPPFADITNVPAPWADDVANAGDHRFVPVFASIPNSTARSHYEEPLSPVPLPKPVNVQLVAEYRDDIKDLLFREEATSLPQPGYMEMQVDLTCRMRGILVDWLIDVHMKYRLRSESLHLTVNIVDRYLSLKSVKRKRLQLVGVASMMIASKFEDIHPPELKDFVYITDNAYTQDEVLTMEASMLAVLNFKIAVPTAAHFFELLQQELCFDDVNRAMAQYLLELTLTDIRMLQYKPSQIASAALLLSFERIGSNAFCSSDIVSLSRQPELKLRLCCDELQKLLEADQADRGGQLRAVHRKFSCSGYSSIATRRF